MQTTTHETRLDSLLRRIKHRSMYDLVLPALALAGIVMAGASITGA
jgi:hypothetical protein